MARRDPAAMDKATARDLLDAVCERRGVKHAELAKLLHLAAGSLSRRLREAYPDRFTEAEIDRLSEFLDLEPSEHDLLLACYGHRPTPSNLPAPLTTFVGRVADLASVRDALRGTRLLTLTGAGGCGKTRLAMEVAAAVRPGYTGGVWLVDLAPLIDPAGLPRAVAAALGVQERPGSLLSDLLVEALAPRRALLLLDNCERLVAPCAELADLLLRRCPRLRILVTSRRALEMAGESIRQVAPLSLPDADPEPTVASLARSDAARLFEARASAVRPDFALTDQNAPAVARICRAVDGLPLALELAAARMRTLDVERLAGRLTDLLGLLVRGNRTALKHQRTLRRTPGLELQPAVRSRATALRPAGRLRRLEPGGGRDGVRGWQP